MSVSASRKQSPAAPAATKPPAPKSAKYVTVACKIPMGLVLQCCRKTTYFEDTPGGARERVRYDKHGQRFVARGTSYPALPPKGFPQRVPTVGGYALTQGIPADFWEQWLEQNADTDMVKNKLIFAYASLVDVRDEAREYAHVLSGLEPLVPDNDPRVPKPLDATAMTSVLMADEMKGRGPPQPEIDEAALID